MRLKQPRRRWTRSCRLATFGLALLMLFVCWAYAVGRFTQTINNNENVKLVQNLVETPVLEYFSSVDCLGDTLLWTFTLDSEQNEEAYFEGTRAIRINSGYAEFYNSKEYVSTLFPEDGCIRMFNFPQVNQVKLFSSLKQQQKQQISDESLAIQRRTLLPTITDNDLSAKPAKYRIVFSCESSEYFGYQVWANKLAFLQSQAGQDCTWTRLLTCQLPDDIAQDVRFPTFQAPPHPYSRRYSPINKPDVIEKWFTSEADAPKEDVIVVIDPDSWLILPLYEQYVSRIRPGNAIGQAAYYAGSTLPQTLWRELCEENCNVDMDLVGVPYVVHRQDLARIAKLWKYYVLKIKYRLEHSTAGSQDFARKYAGLDVNWASEMYAYNMAAAHLGIKHQVVYDLQVRDVDGQRTFAQNANKASVHMGRAWFKRNSLEAKPYLHTEGKGFSFYGDQVWCKCNFTASTIKPWPLPEGLDFQSYHTLRLLHESEEEFGPVPDNEEWRHKKPDLKTGYSWKHP